eukprot:tig00021572_g22422.t1
MSPSGSSRDSSPAPRRRGGLKVALYPTLAPGAKVIAAGHASSAPAIGASELKTLVPRPCGMFVSVRRGRGRACHEAGRVDAPRLQATLNVLDALVGERRSRASTATSRAKRVANGVLASSSFGSACYRQD